MLSKSTAYACAAGLLFILLGTASHLSAQPSVSAGNMALGGGGAAYLNGPEATFYNPANLVIYDRPGNVHLSTGLTGGYFQPVLSTDNLIDQGYAFRDVFLPYTTGDQAIFPGERELILDRNYPRSNVRTSQHLSRLDVILAGIQWQGENQAYSLVARTRLGTRTETGRGWYSESFMTQDGSFVRDFHLTVQNQVLHELSFGYSREFDLINGLFPRINKLYIGIAPKFIIGGAYMDAIYRGRYHSGSGGSAGSVYISSFTHHSSGSYSEMIQDYRSSGNLSASIQRNFGDRFYLEPTGYGLGIDFGLTYLIPLGSDVSVLDTGSGREPVEHSLRIAFSVTDLGIMNYSKSPLSVTNDPDTSLVGNQPPLLSKFVGSPGQFSAYFEQAGSLLNPFWTPGEMSERSFSSLLPTSLNTGVLLDLNRLRFMGDLTLALNKTSFAGTQLTAHFGLEGRPLPFVPVRLGTRFAAGTPVAVGLGTGIETRYWNFSISSQVLLRAATLTSEMVGGAVAALQFHL